MSKNEFLKKIEVKNHCSEEWNGMSGNNEIRFCGHCSLHVNNLSAMTRKQALKLVRDSGGKLCVRYVPNPIDKTPVFAGRLYQISRRAGIAAGILGASISLSTLTYAQEFPPQIVNNEEISQPEKPDEDKTENTTESISATITDTAGAVVSGIVISITLSNN